MVEKEIIERSTTIGKKLIKYLNICNPTTSGCVCSRLSRFHAEVEKIYYLLISQTFKTSVALRPTPPPTDATISDIHFGSRACGRVGGGVRRAGMGGAAMHSRTGRFTSNLPDISLYVL